MFVINYSLLICLRQSLKAIHSQSKCSKLSDCLLGQKFTTRAIIKATATTKQKVYKKDVAGSKIENPSKQPFRHTTVNSTTNTRLTLLYLYTYVSISYDIAGITVKGIEYTKYSIVYI